MSKDAQHVENGSKLLHSRGMRRLGAALLPIANVLKYL
jgi:hypothetical protein